MNVRFDSFVTSDEQSMVDLDGPYVKLKKSQKEETPAGQAAPCYSHILAQGLDLPLTMTVEKIK